MCRWTGFRVRAGHSQHLGGRHGAMDLGRQRSQRHQRTSLLCRFAVLFPDYTNCPAGVLPTWAQFIRTLSQTPASLLGSYFCHSHCIIGMTGVVNVSVVARRQAGQRVRTCLRCWSGRLAFISRLTGNFYTVGGRTSDTAGDDFQHVLQDNPDLQQLDSDGFDFARQSDE